MAGSAIWRGLAYLAVIGGGAAGYVYYTAMPMPAQLARVPYAAQLWPGARPVATGAPAEGAIAQQPRRQGAPGGGRPAVSVIVGKAERKPMPVRLDALGNVQPMATVTLRARVESQIIEVAFDDGSYVKKGDVLVRLDSRQIEAQIKQAEANLLRDQAQLSTLEADLKRAVELARRDFASEQRLDQARASAAAQRAIVLASEANIENLNIQLSYYTLSAPISGRVGVAGLKAGNIAKTGDGSPSLALINQTSPIYVGFSVPQRYLAEVKAAIADPGSTVEAIPQGLEASARGRVAVVDNAVDATTGTVAVKAVFENADELLWPGALTNVRLVLRTEPAALVVPRLAVQPGQSGAFVFVVTNDTVSVREVEVDRIVDEYAVLRSGLEGNETVVTDGHLLLTAGARVVVRQPGGLQPGAPAEATPASAGGGTERPARGEASNARRT